MHIYFQDFIDTDVWIPPNFYSVICPFTSALDSSLSIIKKWKINFFKNPQNLHIYS